MKLLLTGATGFVGRNFLLHAIQNKLYEKVYVPVRSAEKLRAQFIGDGFEGIPDNVVPIVSSAPQWDGNFPEESIDHVVHGAGIIFGRTQKEYVQTNAEGTIQLLKRLKNPKRIVVLSSISASGPVPHGEICRKETDVERTVTWYGYSKLEMEKRLARECKELNYICLRPPIIVGPRDQATLPLFKMAKAFVQFKPGFRDKHYSFIAVGDLVRAIHAVLTSEKDLRSIQPRHLFVAHRNAVTDRELIYSATAAIQKSSLVIPIPQRLLRVASRIVDKLPPLREAIPSLTKDRSQEIWPDRWVVNAEPFRELFLWHEKETLIEAMQATCDWYLKTGQLRNSKVFTKLKSALS